MGTPRQKTKKKLCLFAKSLNKLGLERGDHMKRTSVKLAGFLLAAVGIAQVAQARTQTQRAQPAQSTGFFETYNETGKADRQTFFIPVGQRGNTVDVPVSVVSRFCGDFDGCQLRLGMFNWDGTGRVASRSSLLYYNRQNRNWRAEHNDAFGTDGDGQTTHVLYEWGCYFTDGFYRRQQENDSRPGFGLLSWTNYTASCVLTIID